MNWKPLAVPLLLLSAVTSITVVIDASDWYGSLYPSINLLGFVGISAQFRGILFALLLECFLAVFSAVRLRTVDGHYHPANFGLWMLTIFLLGVIGFGTFEGITQHNAERFSAPTLVQQQIDDLHHALEENRKNADYYRSHQQTVNLARTSSEERDLNARLSLLRANTQTVGLNAILQLVFLAIGKGVLLLVNMTSYWLAGWALRRQWAVPQQEIPQEPIPIPMTKDQQAVVADHTPWDFGMEIEPDTASAIVPAEPEVVVLKKNGHEWTEPLTYQRMSTALRKAGFESWESVTTSLGLSRTQMSTIAHNWHKVHALLLGLKPDLSKGGKGNGQATPEAPADHHADIRAADISTSAPT